MGHFGSDFALGKGAEYSFLGEKPGFGVFLSGPNESDRGPNGLHRGPNGSERGPFESHRGPTWPEGGPKEK